MRFLSWACCVTVSMFFLSGCGGTSIVNQELKYGTPVAIVGTFENVYITGASQNGHLVGDSSPNIAGSIQSAPHYWATPTSTPIVLKSAISESTLPLSVNNSAQIVATEGGSPTYYSDPSATPSLLQLPNGAHSATPSNINNQGQIVCQVDLLNAPSIVYYSSGDAIPEAVDTRPNGIIHVNYLADSGIIYGTFDGTGSGDIPIVWQDHQSSAVDLETGNEATLYGDLSGFNVTTGVVLTAWLWDHQNQSIGPTYWTSPTHPQQFDFAGYPTGISDDGIVCGSSLPGNGNSRALVKPSPTGETYELNSLVSNAKDWNLREAKFILGDGSIVGKGTQIINHVAYQRWFYVKRLQ